MTPEDLQAIRSVIREEIAAVELRLTNLFREEIAASESRLREEIAAVATSLREEIAASERRLVERQERAVEAIAISISELRTEMNARFAEVDRRFESMERRLDRIADNTSALTRWADKLDRDNASLVNTQAAQQRAIDQLAQRIARLEQRAS